MAMDFNCCNSFSSLGLGLGNETIDFPLFRSPTGSNSVLNRVIMDSTNGPQSRHIGSNLGLSQPAGLVSHSVTQVRKSFVSPHGSVQLVHSAIDYPPVQNLPAAFPLTEVAVTHEIVRTTRFLASSSTMDRMFASFHDVRNQGIFPTRGVFALAQPSVTNQPNLVINNNTFLSQNPSRNLEAFDVFNHVNPHGKVKGETVFDPTPVNYPSQQSVLNQGLFSPHMAANLQDPDHNLNNFNYNMNVYDKGHHPPMSVKPSRQVGVPSPQPLALEEVSDENDYKYQLGQDGRTRSLPNYPEGEYGCPRCFVAFDSSQSFASHIRTHYLQETDEEKKRRMVAKCRRKNLHIVHSSHGLTAVPNKSFKRRKSRKEKVVVDIGIPEEVVNAELDLNNHEVGAKKGPLHGIMIKVEPM